MPDKAFFDTNVLIYAALVEDPRSTSAEEVLYAGGTISVQILNEFVSVARRKFQTPWTDVKAALQGIRILCPDAISLTIGIHEDAVRIAEQYRYQIYDALILASALKANCNVIFSEDLRDGQLIDGKLKIENPFR
jgi:predicted nucleic acid-binding protein